MKLTTSSIQITSLITYNKELIMSSKYIFYKAELLTRAFNQLNNIWKNKNIGINNKVRIYIAAVLTILTYGCEI